MDSSKVLDSPSKREVSTYKSALSYQSPTLPARPGIKMREARPAWSTCACSAPRSWPSPRITRSQSGCDGASAANAWISRSNPLSACNRPTASRRLRPSAVAGANKGSARGKGQCTGLGMTARREPGTCCSIQSAVPRVSATTRAARGYVMRRRRCHRPDRVCDGGCVCSVAITRQGMPAHASTDSTDAVVIMPSTMSGRNALTTRRSARTRCTLLQMPRKPPPSPAVCRTSRRTLGCSA
ncbi:hypothetical protein D3C73_1123570 [compost metagenome]